MSFVADIFLGLRDFIGGTLHKTLANAWGWTKPFYPYAFLGGIAVGLAGGGPAGAFLVMFGIPAAFAVAGAGWGLLTGGVTNVIAGMEKRARYRKKAAAAEIADIKALPPAIDPPLAPEPLDELGDIKDLTRQAQRRLAQESREALKPPLPLGEAESRSDSGEGARPERDHRGPFLGFRDSRPSTFISQAELQGALAQGCPAIGAGV